MKSTLREQLIGSWTLTELIEVPVDGTEITYPMGREPKGVIMYNPDGYMSAQIMNTNLSQVSGGASALDGFTHGNATYLAYSGAFHADDNKQVVSHTMYVSLFPDWMGHTQSRIVHFTNGFLHLESGEPFMASGRLVTHRLTWKRVEQ